MNSTKNIARLAGLFWLLFVILIAFSMGYAPTAIVVSGNLSATATNIVALEYLFRTSIAANILAHLAMFLFGVTTFCLFSGVSKILSTVFLTSIMISITIAFVNSLNSLVALTVMTSPDYMRAFHPEQLSAFAMLFLRLNNFGQGLLEIFWTPYLLAFGLIIMKSRYMPKVFGILVIIMSIGYPINTFTKLLVPQFYPAVITELTMMLGALGGIPTIAWLLIMGARIPAPADPARAALSSQ